MHLITSNVATQLSTDRDRDRDREQEQEQERARPVRRLYNRTKKTPEINQRRLNYYCLTVPCDGTQYVDTLQSVRRV
jgi:hypothetical protein